MKTTEPPKKASHATPAKRVFNYIFVLVAAVLKVFPFIHRYLPERPREFTAAWNMDMIRLFLTSGGQRMYADQPCSIRHPASYQPRVETAPEFRLSEAQIRQFYEDGFLGPFTLCSREEMLQLREEIDPQINQPSTIYGRNTWRDRHLDCPGVRDLVLRPEITERFAQILGPNLFLWRSQMHRKEPGAPGFTWHQASTYIMESLYKPALFPADRDDLFEITGWLALDDVDTENGCVQFVKGGHRDIKTMIVGGKGLEGFSNSRFKLEAEIDPEKIVNAELQAGQYYIFSERVIHGSQTNLSNRRRWGMAFRVVPPEVQVYDDEPVHYVEYLGENFDLTHWGGLIIRGEDTAHVNRVYKLPPSEKLRPPVTEVY